MTAQPELHDCALTERGAHDWTDAERPLTLHQCGSCGRGEWLPSRPVADLKAEWAAHVASLTLIRRP